MEMLLKDTSNILGLRETGNRLRMLIEEAIHNNESVILNFEEVESVSSSFADELLAKVYIKLGKEKFMNFIKVKNANDFIKSMINSSISGRLKASNC